MAKLVFKIHDGEDIEYPLTLAETTLGRRDSNDIVINNTWISGNHAVFRQGVDGVYEVTDLESSNGTFVNGERVERVKLRDGDAVSFGQLDTVFVDPASAKSPAPAAKNSLPPTPSVASETIPGPLNGTLKKPEEAISAQLAARTGSAAESTAAKVRLPAPAQRVAGAERPSVAVESPAAKVAQAEAEEQRRALQKQLAELRLQVESVQKAELARREEVERELRQKQEERASLQAVVAEMQRLPDELTAAQSTLAGLQKESKAAQQVLLELTQEAAALRAEAAVLGSKNFQLVQAQGTLAKLKQQIADTQAQQQGELAEHATKLQSLKAEQTSARESLLAMQEKVQAEEVRHLAASDHSAAQLQALQSLHEQADRLATVRMELEETEKAGAEAQREAEVEQKRQREQIAKANEELRALKNEVTQAQAAHAALQKAQGELISVRQALENESAQLIKVRQKSEAEIQDWEGQIASFRQLDDRLRQEHTGTLAALQAERSATEQSLQALRTEGSELELLKPHLVTAKSELSALQQEHRVRQEELATVVKTRSELEAELAAITASHITSQGQFNSLQQSLAEHSAHLERTTAEHRQTALEVAQALQQRETVQRELTEAETLLAERRKQLDESGRQVQEMEATTAALGKLRTDFQSLQQTHQAEKAGVMELQKTRGVQEAELAMLQKELARLTEQQTKLGKVGPELMEKERQLASTQAALEQGRRELDECQKTLGNVQKEKDAAEIKLTQLQSQSAELECALVKTQRQAQEVESLLQAKSVAVDQAHAALENHQRELQRNTQAGDVKLQAQRGELEKLTLQYDHLHQDLAASDQERKARVDALGQLQRDLENTRIAVAEQQAALKAAQSEFQNTLKQLETAKSEQKSLSREVENFAQRRSVVETELRSVEEKLTLEKKSLEQRHRECMELEISIQQHMVSQQQATAQADSMAGQLKGLEQKKSQLQSGIAELQALLLQLEGRQQAGEGAAAKVQQLTKQHTDLTATIQHAEEDLASLQESRVTLVAEVQELQLHHQKTTAVLQAQQKQRAEFQELEQRAKEHQALLAQGPPPLTPSKLARLEEQIKVLEERKQTIAAATDTNWGTVQAMGKNLIKQLDFQDEMISQLEKGGAAPEVLAQLKVLRVGILDMLRDYGISAYVFAPGLVVDLATRKKIQIVESHPSEVTQTQIVTTFRPGYVCSVGSEATPTLLRKAEVSVSTPA